MIRSIEIKCPLCGEVSELFLSMNPTVIVLNCPECWTPLMYSRDEVRILSQNELNTIAAPETETVLDNFFDDITHQEETGGHPAPFQRGMPHSKKLTNRNLMLKTPEMPSRNVITADDIVDLRIELEQCDDVIQFLDKM